MKKIPLSQGKFALVDDEDFEELNKYKWTAYGARDTFYAYRNPSINNGRKSIFMHRQIMNTPEGMQTDHADRNGINNQRKNLRIVTNSQNQMNKKRQSNNSSGFMGVDFHSGTKKYRARINKKGKQIHLGIFNTAKEAAHAYDAAARKYHGEFATTNFEE